MKKIITIIFIFQLACLFLIACPETTNAADTLKLQVPIGDTPEIKFDSTTKPIATYIKVIYKYAIGIVGILATVVMMYGGLLWIMAGGSPERVADAKSWIVASVTGLVLALTSSFILYTINPALVEFKITDVTNVVDNTKPTTKQSDIYSCGQYIDSENICGTKCEGNKKCENVPKGTLNARECPHTGDYWLCTDLSGGGSNCCTSNDDSQCSSGFICNMEMITADCTGKGVCATKQNINGICGEDSDCVSNNCDTGWFATNRCQ